MIFHKLREEPADSRSIDLMGQPCCMGKLPIRELRRKAKATCMFGRLSVLSILSEIITKSRIKIMGLSPENIFLHLSARLMD